MRDKTASQDISREKETRSPARSSAARHLPAALHDGHIYPHSVCGSSATRATSGSHRLRHSHCRSDHHRFLASSFHRVSRLRRIRNRGAQQNGVDNAPRCFDFACSWSDPNDMNRLSQFCALAAALAALSGCSTVSEMVTSNLPESHSGRPSIVVSLREQEAYLYRGKNRTASSRISSGQRRIPHSGWSLSGRP